MQREKRRRNWKRANRLTPRGMVGEMRLIEAEVGMTEEAGVRGVVMTEAGVVAVMETGSLQEAEVTIIEAAEIESATIRGTMGTESTIDHQQEEDVVGVEENARFAAAMMTATNANR